MAYRERDVFSTGEAVVRAWSNDRSDGVPVLICNGLGAGSSCWPGFADADRTEFHVLGYNHRGLAGSGRPLHERDTYVTDHAEDALAVLNAYQVRRALVVGWGFGVAVAFQLAAGAPDRTLGLLAVCGVPDTRAGYVANPMGATTRFRQSLSSGALTAAGALPAPITNLVRRLPVNDRTIALLKTSGLLSVGADPDVIGPAVEHYLQHDVAWYARLSRAASRHGRVDVGRIRVPSTFLAARSDAFLSPLLVSGWAARLPGSHYQLVAGSHFLPLERPDLMTWALRDLARRSAASASDG